jgi:DNA modification methylase
VTYYESDRVTVHHGDCLDVLRELDDNSVDAVCTDPPYGLGFMGKDWDSAAALASRPPSADEVDERFAQKYPRAGKGPAAVAFDGAAFQAWCQLWAAECLRVLKPGGHLVAFGGTRTWHRLACAIEDAGFEVRDTLAWMYGSGFPKSLDVSKAIDKAAGAERTERVGVRPGHENFLGRDNIASLRDGGALSGAGGYERPWMHDPEKVEAQHYITAPATPDAARWQGWGTALKPAYEPVVLARKPLTGTVAGNVLAWGTGALNVDGCRVGFVSAADEAESKGKNRHADFGTGAGGNEVYGDYSMVPRRNYNPPGRWPANVLLDHEAAAMLDEQSGESGGSGGAFTRPASIYGAGGGIPLLNAPPVGFNDSGGASRFFYTAKADAAERPRANGVAHPTVKPLDLMRWLVRLVTPPDGVVLEPFAGSGATVEACILEGFRCVAIEREADYLPLIMQRIHRQTDPVAHHELTKDDDAEPSLFDLLGGDAA